MDFCSPFGDLPGKRDVISQRFVSPGAGDVPDGRGRATGWQCLIDLFQEFERVGVVLISRFLQPVMGFAVVFSDTVALEVEYADHGLRFGIA
jgi:hypothetical protein